MELDVDNLPEEITISLMPLMHSQYGWVTIHASQLDDHVQIGVPMDVTFKIKKREEINQDLVDGLKAESQKIKANAEIRCKAIDEKIQSLLALPASVPEE